MIKRFLITSLMAIVIAVTAFAQETTITGSVVDESGEPLIGASVVQKGSKTGVATDIDGNFTISANQGSILVVSYIGYDTREVSAVNGVRVVLTEAKNALSELVVVGYGVQKKSVVTASIAKVGADDLSTTAPVRVDNALKGLAAGVNVTSSSGQPGAAARIRVRGTGTINNSDPLYIVDGMPIEGGLDYLNPSDIESIEVLKDAASGAVYGARAANGVIIVTTKGGKMGRARVNYDFSYGWQSAWKHRDVLNAEQYAIMMNEGAYNRGDGPLYADPAKLGEGFDWQDAVFNDNAPVMNHEVSVSGATEQVNYRLSLGYYDQEGIVGGNYDRSNYQRLTLRSNTVYTLFDATKQRNWLNKATVTANLSYARIKSKNIDANSTWGSPLGSALSMSPMFTPWISGDMAKQQIKQMKDVETYTGGGTFKAQCQR